MSNARDIYGAKWSEKEYLIVLHCYYAHKAEAQHADAPFVLELAQVLGRTPHSILYRLQNFASIDPTENEPRRKGKVHITEFGKRIFSEWSRNRDSLRDTAEAFLRDAKSQVLPDLFNPNPVRLPVTFRSYELLDEIGRGAFGIVFSCLNTRNNQTHAIKVIDGSRLNDDECIHRFAREIRALEGLRHPNVIRVHESNLETEKGFPGFVMDLGEFDLPKYLSVQAAKHGKRGKRPVLPTSEAREIFTAILDAVRSMHHFNPPIIHRDVNPNNILRLFDGRWVLADFSLAKFLPAAPVSTSFVTATHVGMGTAHYSAPEQYRSLRTADVRADVFSLGWLMWDLFSSEEPYPRREPSGLASKLEGVFLKATSYLPEDRFGAVEGMKRAFEDAW